MKIFNFVLVVIVLSVFQLPVLGSADSTGYRYVLEAVRFSSSGKTKVYRFSSMTSDVLFRPPRIITKDGREIVFRRYAFLDSEHLRAGEDTIALRDIQQIEGRFVRQTKSSQSLGKAVLLLATFGGGIYGLFRFGKSLLKGGPYKLSSMEVLLSSGVAAVLLLIGGFFLLANRRTIKQGRKWRLRLRKIVW